MKYNLGCGEKMVEEPGWLNVDVRPMAPEFAEFLRHDIRAMREIAYENTAEEILLDDVLEHFSKPEAERLVVDLAAILKPGGILTIKTPYIAGLIQWANDARHDEMETALRWFGGNDYPQNCHKFVWPELALKKFLKKHGLDVLKSEYLEDTNIRLTCRKRGK